jgi:hypothetical protein
MALLGARLRHDRSAEAAADVEQAGIRIDADSLRKFPGGAELASQKFPTRREFFLRGWGIIGWQTRYIG